MKRNSFIITGALVAGLALCTPMAAFAQGAKKKADAATGASPAAAAENTTTTTDKPARPIPFHGVATTVDQAGKSFTIEGKTTSRTFKATDQTNITKGGAAATFAELKGDLAEALLRRYRGAGEGQAFHRVTARGRQLAEAVRADGAGRHERPWSTGTNNREQHGRCRQTERRDDESLHSCSR